MSKESEILEEDEIHDPDESSSDERGSMNRSLSPKDRTRRGNHSDNELTGSMTKKYFVKPNHAQAIHDEDHSVKTQKKFHDM